LSTPARDVVHGFVHLGIRSSHARLPVADAAVAVSEEMSQQLSLIDRLPRRGSSALFDDLHAVAVLVSEREHGGDARPP
jgi:hypothetical protein